MPIRPTRLIYVVCVKCHQSFLYRPKSDAIVVPQLCFVCRAKQKVQNISQWFGK